MLSEHDSITVTEVAKGKLIFKNQDLLEAYKNPDTQTHLSVDIVHNDTIIDQRRKEYKDFVYSSFSIDELMKRYSAIQRINRYYKDSLIDDEFLIRELEELSVDTRQQFVSKLRYAPMPILQASPKLRTYIKKTINIEERKVYWAEIIALNKIEGYDEYLLSFLTGFEADSNRVKNAFELFSHVASRSNLDPNLIEEYAFKLYDNIESINDAQIKSYCRVVNRLSKKNLYLELSEKIEENIIIPNLKLLNIERPIPIAINKTRILADLTFEDYLQIRENLVVNGEDYEVDHYSGMHNIKSMDQYSLIADALTLTKLLLERNIATDNEKEVIYNDLIDNKIYKIYGYLEPITAVCFYYINPEMSHKEYEFLFSSHTYSERGYYKLWRIEKFSTEAFTLKAKELKLIPSNSNTEKINIGQTPYVFPFDDFCLKELIQDLNAGAIVFDEFHFMPIFFDDVLDNYLSLLTGIVDNHEVLFFYHFKDNHVQYELSLIDKGIMYTINSNERTSFSDQLRHLTNTILKEKNSPKRFIPLSIIDPETTSVFCEPDSLIAFFNHFELELEAY